MVDFGARSKVVNAVSGERIRRELRHRAGVDDEVVQGIEHEVGPDVGESIPSKELPELPKLNAGRLEVGLNREISGHLLAHGPDAQELGPIRDPRLTCETRN